MSGSGICIADSISGRKILSTHFQNPLKASLAIDSALSSTTPISWVPNLDNAYNPGGTVEIEDDNQVEENGRVWNKKSNGNGLAVCQIERNGLRYITPIFLDVDPIVPLAFLNQLHLVLESYIGGPVTEASLKDNFDVVLELLEEMVSGGRPVLSEVSQLRELVEPPSQLLAKVANVAGLTVSNSQSNATALLTSRLPWRRTGIKYNSNEIYFDITETLSFLLSPNGIILNGSIKGETMCRSRLSGMPDLILELNDSSLIQDCSFHNSVRYNKWGKDKIISFIPPDGTFPLFSYSLSPPRSQSLASTASTPTSFSYLKHFIPLQLKPQMTTGPLGSSFHLTLTSLSTPSNPLSNIIIRYPLGKNISGFSATLSGGRLEVEGDSGGNEKGRFEVEVSKREEEGNVLVWYVGSLTALDRKVVLQGQFLNLNGSKPASALTLNFDCPSSAFSGLRISGLKVLGENYNIYKGVKMRGRGMVEIRC